MVLLSSRSPDVRPAVSGGGTGLTVTVGANWILTRENPELWTTSARLRRCFLVSNHSRHMKRLPITKPRRGALPAVFQFPTCDSTIKAPQWGSSYQHADHDVV